MRLLLLERCELMSWLIENLVPDGVEVQRVDSFEQACAKLLRHDPQAAIFDLTPCMGPWSELATLCDEATPPIPFRWTSADEGLLESTGFSEEERGRFLCRPLPVGSLRWELKALLDEINTPSNSVGQIEPTLKG